ncbi:MAG TPA: MqnA/MqnD/SBP family protein [Pirellulales bacterium]|nr:MqnA/MqnD/SBP family protein [Pirellulales bacterium]
MRQRPDISIAYCADRYDAFFYSGLVTGRWDAAGFDLSFHSGPLAELDAGAEDCRYHLTTVSAAAYPRLADHYGLLGVGACAQRGEGLVLVSRNYHHPAQLQFRRIGVASLTGLEGLLARWACPDAELVELGSAQLATAVSAGQIEAGVLADGEFRGDGALHKVLDLGAHWQQQTGLPLPLRVVVVDRRLDALVAGSLCELLRDSLRQGLEHPAEALLFAASFPGRQSDEELIVAATRDAVAMPDEVRLALGMLFTLQKSQGLIGALPDIEIIDDAAARSWVELPTAA